MEQHPRDEQAHVDPQLPSAPELPEAMGVADSTHNRINGGMDNTSKKEVIDITSDSDEHDLGCSSRPPTSSNSLAELYAEYLHCVQEQSQNLASVIARDRPNAVLVEQRPREPSIVSSMFPSCPTAFHGNPDEEPPQCLQQR